MVFRFFDRQRHCRHRCPLPPSRSRGEPDTQGAVVPRPRGRNPRQRLRPLHQQIQGGGEGEGRIRSPRRGAGKNRTAPSRDHRRFRRVQREILVSV